MRQKFKLTSLLIALVAVLGLSVQSCDNDDLIQVNTAPLFKATNVSASGDKPLTAYYGRANVELKHYSVTVAINGESQTFTGSCNSNELPVIEGNEVDIVVSFEDDALTTNVCFTMPDGSREIVTKADPVCKWIVPAGFKPGDKIIAQWADNSGNIKNKDLLSSITLIALEK